MKKSIFIANWKMNLTVDETVDLIKQLGDSLGEKEGDSPEIVLCPSFVALPAANSALKEMKSSFFKLGAQDVFWQGKGAFTGEVSPKMLKEAGCEYVIIGHSERRENLGETDSMVNKKVQAALKDDMVPIICVGETAEERQKGIRDVVVAKQVGKALENIEIFGSKRIIIAYEPVWVIGSGQAVEPEDAEHSHLMIREALLEIFPVDVVEKHFQIIYGGSVDSGNIKELIDRKGIEGVLVGGASLKVEEFIKMIKAIS